MEILRKIGASVLEVLAYVGALTSLTGRAAYFTFIGPFLGKPARFERAVSQAMEAGVRALPILSMITFFIGLILALQAAYELRRFGAMGYVASAVAVSMTRELGPLITAVIVIGRSGSAFAAELGTMKVTEEIDALETMAIDPVSFLVAPKFVAMILMLPCLTIWGNFMGILGGSLFGVAQADFTFWRYITASLDALIFGTSVRDWSRASCLLGVLPRWVVSKGSKRPAEPSKWDVPLPAPWSCPSFL